ncbi:MAG: hypothetical protein LQ342_005930 [Letrouitia transgressa]|nr:MAG: hypothetical protein LQ342_005930 [Letrouitia transgressa]
MSLQQLNLRSKVAIVTGASRGIGARIAYELAARGAKVKLNLLIAVCYKRLTFPLKVTLVYSSSTSQPRVEELISSLSNLSNGSSATSVQADLQDPLAPERIVLATLSSFNVSQIDILVNNAAGDIAKPFTDCTVSDFSYIYNLNVRAPLLMAQAVAARFPKAGGGGRIINISSVGARCGFKELSLYCSSKAALEGLTRCLAAELGAKGHTVNAVCPGPVQTELLEGIPSEIVAMQKAQTPMENRVGTVEEIASLAGFLAEEGSRWVTGQSINASGGWTMY